MNTLKELKVGKSARVVKVHGEGALRRRIMDMGITKGVGKIVKLNGDKLTPVENK